MGLQQAGLGELEKSLQQQDINAIMGTGGMLQAQKQKKYLNMVVQKKIGGIASGKQRRENRNQMMKNTH